MKLSSQRKSGWHGDTHRHYLAAKYGAAPGKKKPLYMANRDQYMRVDPKQDALENPWEDPVTQLPAKAYVDPKKDLLEAKWDAPIPERETFTQVHVNPEKDIMFVPWSAENPVLAPVFEEAHDTRPAPAYYSMKDWVKEKMAKSNDGVPKDEGGIFGAKFKNDSMLTNARHEQSERKRRVWEDKIEKGVESGEYKSGAHEEFLELFKGLQRQYVNKEITKEQFDNELQSKGEYLLQGHKKTLSVWGDIERSAESTPQQEGLMPWSQKQHHSQPVKDSQRW
jgi:hypothetical protein